MALSPNQALAREKQFQSQLAFGQIAETDIARWLIRRGNVLLPIYEKEIDTGKGPRIFYEAGDFIAPDLLVLRGSNGIYWIEAKHKTVFTWHRKTQRWTTGIDQHHYNQYCKVRDFLGFTVWLLFLHESSRPDSRDLRCGCPPECPTGLFGGDLDWLRLAENHDHPNHGRSGMVYWAYENSDEPWKNLKRIATLEEVKKASEQRQPQPQRASLSKRGVSFPYNP